MSLSEFLGRASKNAGGRRIPLGGRIIPKSSLYGDVQKGMVSDAFDFVGGHTNKVIDSFSSRTGQNTSDLIFDIIRKGIDKAEAPAPSIEKKFIKGLGIAAESGRALAAVGAVGLIGGAVFGGVGDSARILMSRNNVVNHDDFSNIDKKTVGDYFDVISTYSPATAANPIVARNLVNKMITFGGVDHKLVQDLTTIQRSAQSDTPSKSIDSLIKYNSPGMQDLMKSEAKSGEYQPFYG